MKTIIMTGGGSAGHVTPNIALIPKLKERGYSVHYIGSHNGMERQLVEREGIQYHPVNAGKLRRYFDLKNVTDIFRILDGFRQSMIIINRIKPDVVFSKGGFVSCPVVWAARTCKVPVVIHESDITPGLANRLSIPFSSKVCFTFPETGEHIPGDKGVLTGLPIRANLFEGERNTGRQICGFTDNKPVILVIGGSLGSENINFLLRKSLKTLLKDFNICHICGKGNIKSDLNSTTGYRQYEYVNEEMSHLMAVADIAVSRAGATTIFELLALKKPNLLIPLSKKASRGDQILNAESFRKQGFSRVITEEELSEKALLDNIYEVLQNKEKYVSSMRLNSMENAVDEIIGVIEGIKSNTG